MAREPMTVGQLIHELEYLKPDLIVHAGPNRPEDGPVQPVVSINFTYGWILTEPKGSGSSGT